MASTSASAAKFDFLKFDFPSNFKIWQRRVKALLGQQRLLKVISSDTKPEDMKEEEWLELNGIAVNIIESCVSDRVLSEIEEGASAKKVWEKLEAVYHGKTITNRVYLQQRLYTWKLEEGGDLTTHIQDFVQLRKELASIGNRRRC